jgi:polar amino acid transport system substrate-binding protein
MTHTKVRDDIFKWVGPLATKRDILVAKKGSGTRINSLEDAKKVKRMFLMNKKMLKSLFSGV